MNFRILRLRATTAGGELSRPTCSSFPLKPFHKNINLYMSYSLTSLIKGGEMGFLYGGIIGQGLLRGTTIAHMACT